MPIPVTNRPIKNEAQRLLIARNVVLSELAAVTGSSRAAAGYWMQGHTLPAHAARTAIEARWPEVRAALWDTLPATMRSARDRVDASKPAPAEPEPDSSPDDHKGRMCRHLEQVEKQIEVAHSDQRISDWVKLGTLKQKILADLARHSGQLGPIEPARLTRTDKFIEVRRVTMDALVPFPEAREALERALEAIDA